jgi:hypothetical protein
MTCQVKSGVCCNVSIVVVQTMVLNLLKYVPACLTCRQAIQQSSPLFYEEFDSVRELLGGAKQ